MNTREFKYKGIKYRMITIKQINGKMCAISLSNYGQTMIPLEQLLPELYKEHALEVMSEYDDVLKLENALSDVNKFMADVPLFTELSRYQNFPQRVYQETMREILKEFSINKAMNKKLDMEGVKEISHDDPYAPGNKKSYVSGNFEGRDFVALEQRSDKTAEEEMEETRAEKATIGKETTTEEAFNDLQDKKIQVNMYPVGNLSDPRRKDSEKVLLEAILKYQEQNEVDFIANYELTLVYDKISGKTYHPTLDVNNKLVLKGMDEAEKKESNSNQSLTPEQLDMLKNMSVEELNSLFYMQEANPALQEAIRSELELRSLANHQAKENSNGDKPKIYQKTNNNNQYNSYGLIESGIFVFLAGLVAGTVLLFLAKLAFFGL